MPGANPPAWPAQQAVPWRQQPAPTPVSSPLGSTFGPQSFSTPRYGASPPPPSNHVGAAVPVQPGHGAAPQLAPTLPAPAAPGPPMGAPAPRGTSSTKAFQAGNVRKIGSLTAYEQRNFRLVARVTKKSEKRTFNYKSKEGQGQMFSIDILDKTGEARCVFFGEAATKFFDVIEERRVFLFGGGRVKEGNSKWCPFKWEITFDEQAIIQESDDVEGCPQIVFAFRPLSAVATEAVGSTLDVACILAEVGPAETIPTKNGERVRRNVLLYDSSNTSCRLTLWGDIANLPWSENTVALLKSLKIGDFGGRSLSSCFTTSVRLGEEALSTEEKVATELMAWFQQEGRAKLSSATSLTTSGGGGSSSIATLEELKDECRDLPAAMDPRSLSLPGQALDGAEGAAASKGLYHTVALATITRIERAQAPFYMACSQQVKDAYGAEGKLRSCNKKAERRDDGWVCGGGHVSEDATARWNLRFQIADHTGIQFMSCFDEVAQKIMGKEAKEVAELWEAKELGSVEAGAAFEKIFQDREFTRWRFRLRTKKEFWNDEPRLKHNVVDATPSSFIEDGRAKLNEVNQSLAQMNALSAGAGA